MRLSNTTGILQKKTLWFIGVEVKDESPWGGGGLPYKTLMGMCRWMRSHLHDLIDYNGVVFSIELLVGSQIFQ